MAETRNYKANAAGSPPSKPSSPSTGYPQTKVQGVSEATVPGPYWYYQIGEEIRNAILAGGLTPDFAAVDQIKTVLEKSFGHTNNGDPNGVLAASRLHERCWDTSLTPAKEYIATAADGTVGGTTWQRVKPAGRVEWHASETPPPGMLECDGSAVSRSTYAVLFNEIGTAHGEGDGSTTFNLPDIRGEFVRGWDHGRGADPDAASRNAAGTNGATGDSVGSTQADEFESHNHTDERRSGTFGTNFGSDENQTNRGSAIQNTSSAGGNETRPRNVYLMACIEY